MRAKVRFQRIKFERFMATQWHPGMNPCLKLPPELQVVTYPQSFRYYDAVPLIFSHYVTKKCNKGQENRYSIE